ncbi:MAG: branched-chain amino acid ABC transporter ATP-binding protein/permease, partial [Bacillota bacterium]|nr:branched-chain amino acid ABC transporter ATP-binding protein/permease [Bacillota bacterium]
MTRERLGVLFLFFLWIGLPFLLQGRLSLSLFITAFIQVPMVVGLTLLGGRAGMISLGQAAFYGVGAYGTAILAVHGGWPPVLALGGGIFLTVAVAYLVGLPVLTLRGHDFVLATLALNFIFGVVWRQWLPVTGGSNGLAGIPSLSLGTWAIRGDVSYYYLTGLVALLALFFGYQLLHSGTGRALQTVMASETAAAAVGLRPSRYRLGVFLWAAFWAGLSGGLYAFYVGYVSPSPFSLEFSVQLLLMAVIGGLGSLPGAVVGVFLALFLRESLRTFLPQVVGGISSEYEAVAYGLLLALVVIFWPRGLWPARAAHPAAAGEVATHLPEDPLPAEGVILSVEGLRREFGGLVAVADVSFQVRRGEVVALLGPNGAGKTTLFHMISGLLPPTRGRVVFAGKEVTGLPPYLPAALGLGRTFQIPKLVPTLPPRDNVSVGLPYPWRGSFWQDALRWARRRRAREAVFLARHFLQRVGEKGEEKPLEALPFGRWRTTELARALAGRPRLLLLDEPASGLSPQEKEAFLKAMKDFSRRGGTILWVEHDVPLVMAGADRVLVMNGGRLVAQGTPEEVQKNPAVQEAYL